MLPDSPRRPLWPRARLDPAWVDANADAFDVFHVHFGFDAVDPSTIAQVCTAGWRRAGPGGRLVTPLRIGIVAGARFPIREPYAGGMEAHTHILARALGDLGHDVVLFATGGPDDVSTVELTGGPLSLSPSARSDVSMPPDRFMAEHHACLGLMLGLDAHGLDVPQNNSLHYLPVAMAGAVSSPVVTTLHAPPTPWLESAVSTAGTAGRTRFASVPGVNARAWGGHVAVDAVIHNGVDVRRWRPVAGPRHGLVWTGRIVPERGTHVAVQRGAIPELIDAACGCVADDDSVDGLVRAVRVARRADPRACRPWAVVNASVRAMAERYCDVYASALAA